MDANGQIVSLYTSKPQDKGLRYPEEALLETNLSHEKNYFILDYLTYVLGMNYFRFEDEYFWQRQGTSMGAAVAPLFANIFVLFLRSTFGHNIIKYVRGLNHPTQGHAIKVKGFFTCETTNVFYLINSPCGKAYVGQTKLSTATEKDRACRHGRGYLMPRHVRVLLSAALLPTLLYIHTPPLEKKKGIQISIFQTSVFPSLTSFPSLTGSLTPQVAHSTVPPPPYSTHN
ncbi:hypothetical protein XELAEV_18026881mg [Xenopus laevis]|uniref:Uncharacterized protein n=1 Tax=Xenopus laevis TaxID=8355 RepID=A0A974HJE9_XENLA|nr:hypothetical protein XELAEV_18026881mg [Xenopus laevis]